MFLSLCCLKSQSSSLLQSEADKFKASTQQKIPTFSGEFWKQMFEPGKEPEAYLQKSERFNQWQYITVDSEKISVHPNKSDTKKILNQLYLQDIYDVDNDNAKEGKCCSRIIFNEFPPAKCYGKKCKEEEKKRKSFPPTQEQMDKDPFYATNCIHIYIYQQVSWRFCHRIKAEIIKLKNAITFHVLMTIPGLDMSTTITKYIQHASNTPVQSPDYWDWHEQKNWGGNCNTSVMQSPIDIIAPVKGSDGATGPKFQIDYKFEKEVAFEVGLNGVEIVVKFTDYAGAMKITYDKSGSMVSFVPRWMSFRFPAEHLINKYRFDGEIIIVMDEITPRNNKSIGITNGMEVVVPIQFNPRSPEYPELDKLNPDTWRHEVKERDNKTFTPKNTSNGKPVKFELHSFMTKIFKLNSDSSLYLGSSTTPPCLDHVLQLVFNRPLMIANCQFKDLRENTLLSDKTKETHARDLQFNDHGGPKRIKNIKHTQVKFSVNLGQLTPVRGPGNFEVPKPKVKLTKKQLKKAAFHSKANCDLEATKQIKGIQ